MTFIIGLLTVVLVLNCLLLILLVLIQLPKKEAGAGLAFGGAATDALFGAGSGNVLTKVTKYATVVFFVLAVILGVMQGRYYHGRMSEVERKLQELQSKQASGLPNTPITPDASPVTPRGLTNFVPVPPPGATNAPAITPENPVPATAPTNPAPATAPPK